MSLTSHKLLRAFVAGASFAVFALVLTACWNSGDHPGIGLNASQIVGTWAAKPIGGNTPTLRFSSDGSFIAESVPEWLACNEGDESAGAIVTHTPAPPTVSTLVTEKGRWSSGDGFGTHDTEGFDATWITPDGKCDDYFNTEKLDGVFRIFQWRGDPDSDVTQSFVKSGS